MRLYKKNFTQTYDTIGLLTIEIREVNMGLFNKDVKNENKASDISTTTVESKVNKRLYLVDYENVSDAGLVGVDQLYGNDKTSVVYKATSKIFENAKT